MLDHLHGEYYIKVGEKGHKIRGDLSTDKSPQLCATDVLRKSVIRSLYYLANNKFHGFYNGLRFGVVITIEHRGRGFRLFVCLLNDCQWLSCNFLK